VRLRPECRRLSWNEAEYHAFRAAVREGDVVIEAGANAGAYTVLFARWVGGAGHVYAFEPVPSIARTLAGQLRLNGVADRVTVIPAALGLTHGTVDLLAPGLNGINRVAASADARTGSRIRVPVVPLDEFCARERITPDVIKMDVEGAELEVLRGARHTIASSPDLHLFIEWHPTLWTRYGITAVDVREELSLQRLQAEPLRPGDDVWRVEGICARVRRSG
jgi:FkbM family methyltransferase